ncbi:MAG: UDP-N-acetylmuramate--L-alanine ligase [Actinobacteria bacterium]|nr:UDP-N-acetylmuramate--L-alanine ligase [Actinomycetota bacterium]
MKVVIAGGGTAGHVFPAIALARRLVEEHDARVTFVGTLVGQEAQLVPAAGFEFHGVSAEQMPRKLSAKVLRAPFTALASVRACRPLVADADVVVGMGGYASLPAVLAARWTRIPLVLHEQNAVPGLANRLAARWARTVALSFADASARLPKVRTVVTGDPVREAILDVPRSRDALAKEAWEELELEPGRSTIVVIGGSQGALSLDRAVAGAVPLLAGRADLQPCGRACRRDQHRRADRLRGSVRARALPVRDREPPASQRERARAGGRGRGAARRAAHARNVRCEGRVPAGRPRSAGADEGGGVRVGEARRGFPTRPRGRGGGVSATVYSPPPGSIPTLEVPDLTGVRRVHMIGIGGAGMRNLAKLMLARGIAVSGSDLKDSKGVRELRDAGAEVAVGHAPQNVGDPDAVVISSAILERNVELREARRRSLPVWARAQVLAAAATGYRAIAVAGTHGKTTTTSMVAVILERAGLDPTFVIGGDLNEIGSGARAGAGDLFVAEADESDGSFLLMRPAVGIVTNVEIDHVDFYGGGREEIESAFAAFARRCGHVVVCCDDEGALRAIEASGVPGLTYGTAEGSDARLRVASVGPGGAAGTLRLDGGEVEIRLRVDGAHNLLNAAAAVAATGLAGVDAATAAAALASFMGVRRRFEHRGSARGADFYDDYGHVPTELAVTLDVARRTGPNRLVAVFQPHRYSRTQALWRELGASLVEADLVVVTDVYGADQDPIPGVTGGMVVEGIRLAAPGKAVVYLPHRADVVRFLAEEVREGDLVVTMGCGDVWMLGEAALERIRESG